jgi:hypothetical protein
MRSTNRVSSPRPQRPCDEAHQGRNDQRRKHMNRHVIRQPIAARPRTPPAMNSGKPTGAFFWRR